MHLYVWFQCSMNADSGASLLLKLQRGHMNHEFVSTSLPFPLHSFSPICLLGLHKSAALTWETAVNKNDTEDIFLMPHTYLFRKKKQ